MSVDRDRILEQALKHELRLPSEALAKGGGTTAVTPGCLDAETLAAWQDDSLDAAQMEAIEQHVSTCARCQSLLAAFARGTASTSATESTPVTLAAPRTLPWYRWWLAPIAAGAVAVTMWMVVPEQQQVATRPQVPQSSVAVDKVQPPAILAEKQTASEPAPAVPAAPAAADSIETRARAAEVEVQENKVKADTARDDRQQFKDQAVAAPKEEVALSQAAPAPAAVPLPGVATVVPPARAEAGARIGALQKRNLGPAIATTPDGAVAWRISNGFIVRYDNNSEIGTALHRFAADETITTGAAPNATTLWLAGRAGVVLLSTDANAFTRVDLPQRVDIVRLDAAGSQSVTALTTDGRQFRTEDGGRTWRLIQA